MGRAGPPDGADPAAPKGPVATTTDPSPSQGPPEPPDGTALPRRFGINVLANYSAQAVTALSALVVTPLLLHHVGRSAFGVWALAASAVSYLELLDLGFGDATTKLVAEDARVRNERAVRTLNTTFFILVPLGGLCLLAGFGLAAVFPSLVHIPEGLRGQGVVVVAVLSLGLAASIPGDIFGGAMAGYQRFDLLGWSNLGFVLVTGLSTVAVVLAGGGLVALAITTTVVSVCFHTVRWILVRHMVPEARIRPRLVDRSRIRSITRLSGWFLGGSFLGAAYRTTDVILVGILLGVRPAALYAVGSKLAKAAAQAVDSLSAIFFPFASATGAGAEKGDLADIVVDGTRVTILVGAVAGIVLMVLAGPAIGAWVGPGYAASAQVLVILAAAGVAASPVAALMAVLNGSGHVRLVVSVAAAEVTVNIVLSVILIETVGLVGAALGTLVSIALVRLPGIMIFGSRAAGIGVGQVLRRAVLPHVAPALGCVAVLFALRPLIGHSLAMVVIAALAGVSAYLVLYVLVAAPAAERRRIFDAAGSLRKSLLRRADAA